jgi:hypothetical protein
MNDSEQIATFCSELIGGPDGHGDDRLEGLHSYLWAITTAGTKRTRWLRAEDSDAIASAAVELAERQPDEIAHIYLGTCLVDETTVTAMGRDAWAQRATNATAAGIMAVCVDIDIAGPEHASKPYPPDLAAAESIYRAVAAPPSIVVHSGNGIHVWWVLSEPWLVRDAADPDAERATMARFAQDWSSTLRYHADRLGHWKIDSTFDLARVMRLPGTLNVRPSGITRPLITYVDSAARYEPDDLTAAMVDPEVLEAYRQRAMPGLSVKELPGIDLSQVWARVTSAPYRQAGYTPAWLAELLELMPGSKLEATWEGYREGLDDPSQSGLDASLVRLLHDRGIPTEGQVEALMCRRLRVGEKVDKIDPHRRTDYLVRTVAKVHALAAVASPPGRATATALTSAWEQAASGRVTTIAPPAPAPEPPAFTPPDPDGAQFGAYANALINGSAPAPEPPPEDEPAETGPPAAPLTVAAPAVTHIDPWGQRPKATIAALETLAGLVIPEPYRNAGIEIWRLEYRDLGDQQRGRMVLRIPEDYEWPAERPPLYRPGRPLLCSWYKRDMFDTPKAFRWSLMRDALIGALEVGNNREAWANAINMLVPYWQRDTSGTDIMAQMHEWLLEFLCGHPATLDPVTAMDNRRALLLEHAEWGTDGDPVLLLFASSFVDYISGRPGGGAGRHAKTQLGYLHLEPWRRRLSGPDGKRRRASWLQVMPTEFSPAEWGEILEAAREAAEIAQRRGLRVVDGGRS